MDSSNGFAAWLADRCAERGISYRPDLLVRYVQTAAAMADAGFGVAFVPRSALAPGMRSAQLDPPLKRPVLAITRTDHDPMLDELIALVQQQVAADSDPFR